MSGLFKMDGSGAGGLDIMGGGPQSGGLSGGLTGQDVPSDMNLPGGMVPGSPGNILGGGVPGAPTGAPMGGTPIGGYPAGGVPGGFPTVPGGFGGPRGGSDPTFGLGHILDAIAKHSGRPGGAPQGGGVTGGINAQLPAILAMLRSRGAATPVSSPVGGRGFGAIQ